MREIRGHAGVPATGAGDVSTFDDARTRLGLERAGALEQIESLVKEFDGIVESSDLVATDDEHDPEGHTVAFERQQIAAILSVARSHLIDINEAISRCDLNTYGACEHCERRITDERLDAIPAARTCIYCASGSGVPGNRARLRR